LSAYKTWIDPRAAKERNNMRRTLPRDICSGTMRLALHLSDLEHEFLMTFNPELQNESGAAWAKFIAHPDSTPFRVNKV
jgi:hypothetical protein